ncbi:MAG TPA: cation:proton antiporter [Nitrososphaeraceae archaeon]|nr:cation:proton antiporter [Nitrososphaeraceae archaeon]
MALDLSASLLVVCGFLVSVSAIQRYASNFIIPGVTIMMFIGAISVIVPLYSSDFKSVYDSIVEKAPDLILLVIIPLLIFESSRKLTLKEIRSQITPIGFFAIIGVILTIILVGIAISIIFKVPIVHGLLFGSIVAATDAAAVAAIFKRFPIPHRLNLIIEGESLFNDATGVISFNVIKGIIFSNVAFSLIDTSLSFLWSMLGAVALGSAIGYVGGMVLSKWQADDHVNFTFSIALAIGGYIIGDHILHVSGVVTTVFIALLMLRTHKETFTGVGRQFNMYWDYLGFITNSILFFLVGIPVFSLFVLQSNISRILIIIAPIAIVMISRLIVVYGGSIILRIASVRIPLQWQNILTLGGLRGGICVALVLSLPAEYEFKNLFVTLTISLIAVNLIINPVLLGRYLKKSKVTAD